MHTRLLCTALSLLAAAKLGADQSLVHARQAQALLGPDVWSQVIRVENTARNSPYPKSLHALVFELEGVLWFYSDVDGTQSFSLQYGRLAQEKEDFAPLLRDIDPGFTHWSVVPATATVPVMSRRPLPNGCFIKSVAASRALGPGAKDPVLLTYYLQTRAGLRGHTVLTYEARGHLRVFDPDWPDRTEQLADTVGRDALALARAVRGSDVANARAVPLNAFNRPTREYASSLVGSTPDHSQS